VTVASDVGGLSELAAVTVPADVPAELARGIERLRAGGSHCEPLLDDAVAAAHVHAHGMEPAA
jgi:hypothetical protein